jgi:hypothetical protein
MQLEKKALEEEETSEDDESQRSSVQSGSQQDFPSKFHRTRRYKFSSFKIMKDIAEKEDKR